jgi:universal stress protein A
MKNYQRILLAVDFFEQNQLVIDQAQDVAAKYQASLSLVHVVDNLPFGNMVYDDFPPYTVEMSTILMDTAKKKLSDLATRLVIAEQDTYLELGSPKTEIIKIANQINADLIVLGSHGRHGFGLLLGSTANGVLHHAKCDVLAVRLSDEE